MHPLEITRNAIGNWSDAELKALAVAVKQATEACGARTPEQFSGEDLIAYTRLCALGQQWPTVITAADRYITSTDAAKPQIPQSSSPAFRCSKPPCPNCTRTPAKNVGP